MTALKRLIMAVVATAMTATAATAQQLPKREFRGAWIPTVGDRYYATHTTEQNKAYLLACSTASKPQAAMW